MGKILHRGIGICLLIGIGFGIVAVLLLTYGQQVENIYIGTESFAIAPIYNRNSSWLHGRLGIGSKPLLYFAELIVTLLLEVFCFRFMTWMNKALRLSGKWNHIVDFMLAVTIARIITVLTGNDTLDYLYIAQFHATYDLFDFYIGFTIIAMLIWCILAEIKLSSIKKKALGKVSFLKKLQWELIFTKDACKAAFLPYKQQEILLQKYEYTD